MKSQNIADRHVASFKFSTVYHGQGVLVVEHAVDVVDDLSGVVVWDLTGPAGPDALGSVHQHQRDDGNVPLWLHLLVVIVQELQQVGVPRREQQFGQRTVGKKKRSFRQRTNSVQILQLQMSSVVLPEHGEDVTRAGSVFASVDTSTELTQRLQDVHVVAAHKVLGQVHDGHHQSLLQGHMGDGCSVIVTRIENL